MMLNEAGFSDTAMKRGCTTIFLSGLLHLDRIEEARTMTNRLRTYLWIFSIMGIIGGFSWVMEHYDQGQRNPGAESLYDLAVYCEGFGLSLAHTNSSLEEVLVRHDNEDLLDAVILLIARDETLKPISDNLRRSDGWGRPYNVEWRTNMVGVASPMLKANQDALLIWSSGENGVNEYGNGDDIFDYGDWTIYRDDIDETDNL